MKIKFGTFWFLGAVAFCSFAMQHLEAMATERTVVVKEQTVLGHRIGPSGQEMLVVK